MLHIARLLFAGLLLPALMLCAHVGAANAQQPKWAVSYSGIDVAKDAYYSYSGIVVSTKRDLSKSGIMLQGFMGYGGYDYDNPSVTGGNVDGDLLQFSGLVGYMFVRSTGSASVYVGVDYQDHDLDPADPSNEISGSEVGFKVTGDVRHVTDQHYLTLEGSYSTAFNAYWSRFRIGMTRGRFSIGPEALAIGNDGFDAQRVGGFAVMRTHLSPSWPVELTLSGGYQFLDTPNSGSGGSSGGGEGVYGAVNFSIVY